MATYVREDDGSLRRLDADEQLPDDALARGFFMAPDVDGQPPTRERVGLLDSDGPAAWPAGWTELGVTVDGPEHSLFHDHSTAPLIEEHRRRAGFTF